MRYSKSLTKRDPNTNNRVSEMPQYNNVPPAVGDFYMLTTEGSRLDLISNQFYQTPKFWWVIAVANGIGKGTLFVKPGIQLRIPVNPQKFVDKINA